MNKKQEKNFIRINIIIYIITMILIGIVFYVMKNMEWWKIMLALFMVLICSIVLNTFNIVFHFKK